MWIFSVYGFYSVSWDKGRGRFAIRARTRAHLVALAKRFNLREPIAETERNDYRFRIMLKRERWLGVAAELMAEQTWSNFKTEAERMNGKGPYVTALHDVWHTMGRLQPGGPYGAAAKRKN
jgi:hypothetical protein